MLYAAYQAQADVMGPVRMLAGMAARSFGHFGIGMPGHGAVRNLTAAYELIARAGLTHSRPSFGIGHVTVGNRDVEVREEAAHVTPFGTLLHFRKDIEAEQPRVMVVAPLRCSAAR
jgi:poly(3-hydroxybutyrate) depolymerase